MFPLFSSADLSVCFSSKSEIRSVGVFINGTHLYWRPIAVVQYYVSRVNSHSRKPNQLFYANSMVWLLRPISNLLYISLAARNKSTSDSHTIAYDLNILTISFRPFNINSLAGGRSHKLYTHITGEHKTKLQSTASGPSHRSIEVSDSTQAQQQDL